LLARPWHLCGIRRRVNALDQPFTGNPAVHLLRDPRMGLLDRRGGRVMTTEQFNTLVNDDIRHLMRKQMLDRMAILQQDIEWNIRRLCNLVLEEEDREQIEDLVKELREEKQSLEWCSR
jgi:hypothetical protein